jgi:hypothetical protein
MTTKRGQRVKVYSSINCNSTRGETDLAGSFLDTTIVIHISETSEPDKSKGEAVVAKNQPAEVPYYALRELLTGRVRSLCETHNRVKAAQNVAEALLGVANVWSIEGRKKDARIQAFAESMRVAFMQNPQGPREDLKREILQDLAIRTTRLWKNARKAKGVDTVQPLSCFNDGKLGFGVAGELRGPNNSFNCAKSERCAAAAYIYDDRVTLSKMIAALHPNKLGAPLADKHENKQRRKALKELDSRGPVDFPKTSCRALGDAYFAAMCPPGSVVVTSNLVDHEPLCTALGKTAIIP